MKLQTATALTLTLSIFAMSQASAADLRMSWWGGESRHTATQEALQICGDKYGHTISPEFTGFDGYLEKLTTQMAGGTEADIVQVNWPWLPLFSFDGDGFLDLTSQEDIIDLSQWSADQLAPVTIQGKLQGLPLSTTGRVFFFNTTTLSEAGLEVPKTWDEFFAAAEALRAKLGKDHNLFNSVKETAQLLVTLSVVQKTGKDLVDPDTNRVAWTPDELAEGIAFYQRMVETGAVRSQKDEAGEGNVNLYEKQDWAQGKIAGSYEWDTTYFKYSDPLNDGEVLDSAQPISFADALSDGAYRKPSMLFAISRHSANPEAAAQIVNCMLTEAEGIDALKDTRGLPASKVAAERLIAAGMIKPEIIKAHDIIMSASGPAVSPFNEHPELRSAFIDTLEEVSYGMLDAQKAAEVIIDEANDVLEGFDN